MPRKTAKPAPDPAPAAAEARPLDPAPIAEGPLSLPGVLDLNAAADLARALLARRGAAVSVDAAEVGHLGAQCAQVLVSAVKTWAQDGVALSVVNRSAEFDEGLRLLGLEPALAGQGACA